MTKALTLMPTFLRDRRGATIVEFALVLPVFATLVLGILNTAMLAHTISSMNFAVEEAARCYAVNATVCTTPVATETFARGRYMGPEIAPVFDANTTGCGHTVTATASFPLNVVLADFDIPLAASACYPGVEEEAA